MATSIQSPLEIAHVGILLWIDPRIGKQDREVLDVELHLPREARPRASSLVHAFRLMPGARNVWLPVAADLPEITRPIIRVAGRSFGAHRNATTMAIVLMMVMDCKVQENELDALRSHQSRA